MLKQLGYNNLDDLTNAAVPDNIKLGRDLHIGDVLAVYLKVRL